MFLDMYIILPGKMSSLNIDHNFIYFELASYSGNVKPKKDIYT